jgi:hypothetical protein
MTKIPVLALLLMGCGEPFLYSYKVGCFEFVANHKLYEQNIQTDIDLAQYWIGNEFNICEYQGRIIIRADDQWACEYAPHDYACSGEARWLADMMLSRNGAVFVHELYHYHDFYNGNFIGSQNHTDWDKIGRTARIDAYGLFSRSMSEAY